MNIGIHRGIDDGGDDYDVTYTDYLLPVSYTFTFICPFISLLLSININRNSEIKLLFYHSRKLSSTSHQVHWTLRVKTYHLLSVVVEMIIMMVMLPSQHHHCL